MRKAHIVTREHEVGDRVLALCGKEHKVKTLWEDIPEDSPICRLCVDAIVAAADQADEMIQKSRYYWRRAEQMIQRLGDELNPESTVILDAFSDAADLFELLQTKEKQDEEDRVAEQRTCTCEWTDSKTFTVDPNCPIHGRHDDPLPPVAPEEQA